MEQEEFDSSWTVPQQYIINSSELVLKEVIGTGAEGKVYNGTWSNIAVAVKEILAPEGSDGTDSGGGASSEAALYKAQVLLKHHVALMTSLNHPNLVRFCGVCMDPPLLVMEYYHHGSVFNLLEKARRQWAHSVFGTGTAGAELKEDKWPMKYIKYLHWDRRLEMLHDIVAGMTYLHKKHYVHGDLRSPNLLIGQDGRVKIGDFGFARRVQGSGSSLKVEKLTHPRWVAPELMYKQRLSMHSDVYSFGIIMYEMLTWQLPFHELDKEQVVMEVLAGNRPVIPAEAGLPPGTSSHTFLDRYIQLMQECWAQDPLQRPDFERIASRLRAWIRWRRLVKDFQSKAKAPVAHIGFPIIPPISHTDPSKAEQAAPAVAAAAAGSSHQAEEAKSTAAGAMAAAAVQGHKEQLSHSQLPVTEVASAFSSVPVLEMYDLDLKEVPVGSNSYRVYHGTWFEAEVTVLQYRPELTWQGAGKGHQGPSQAGPSAQERLQDKLLAAVHQLSGLSHPNVIRLCGYCLQPPVLVTEYQRHGTVHSLLQRAQRQLKSSSSVLQHTQSKLAQYLRWKRRLQMLQEALSGVMFLHSEGYLLGQLSSNDMFVGSDGKVRLGMCGPLKSASSEAAGDVTITQPRWTAPEVLEQKTQSAASDVYSFGIVMYEMLTFQMPFEGLQDDEEVVKHVLKGGRPVIPSAAELPPGTAAAAGLEQYLLLMQQCWDKDPNCRPPLQQLAQGLKALSTAGTVQSSTGKSLLVLPTATQRPLLDAEDNPPEVVELPTIGEEDFSPPGTPPPSCGVSSLGFQSQYLHSLFRKGPEGAGQQQLQEPASSGSEVSTSSQPALTEQPEQPRSSPPAAAEEETQPQEAAEAFATTIAAQPRLPAQPAAAGTAANRRGSGGRAAVAPQSAAEELQQEQPYTESPSQQLADSAVAGVGREPGCVTAQLDYSRPQSSQQAAQLPALSSATGTAAAATRPTDYRAVGAASKRSLVQDLIVEIEELQPQLTSSIQRLLVLCTTYVANNAVAYVQQQLQQCPNPGQQSPVQSQASRSHQRQDQQQQLVTFQLQAVLVLLRSSLVQQPAAQGSPMQMAGQLVMLLVGLSDWRRAAGASVLSSSSSGGGGRQSAVTIGVYAALAACLLSWFVLPQVWFAAVTSVLAGSYAVWHQSQPNHLHDEAASAALERQQQRPTPPAPERLLGVDVPVFGFSVYDRRSDIAGTVSVALQPDSSSSSVGYASWSATWQPAGAALTGAGALQLQVLHTLPPHRYFCSRQQRRGIHLVAAGQGAVIDGELVKDQDQAVGELEQRSAHSRHDPVDAGAVPHSQQVEDLHHHPVLSSQGKEQPPDGTAVHVLGHLMQRQQQRDEEQQQQAQQRGQAAESDGDCTSIDQPAPVPRYGDVLWVCLDPPMMLEGFPAGNTAAAWLLQQQQQQQQHSTLPQNLSDSTSSSGGAWLPPFAAAHWPQVLIWLQQVAAALAEIHGQGGVYGGVHAGTVYLVEHSTPDGSGGAGVSRRQIAVLSLVVPWQHAVTRGCLVDGALAPPEVLMGKQHPNSSAAVDVYGFGMLLWQFATGWVPQQQQQLALGGGAGDLGIYDELCWCAGMMQMYGTTFPDAAAAAAISSAAAAAKGLERAQTDPGSAAAGTAGNSAGSVAAGADTGEEGGWMCRHGSLPSSAQAWLPAGYKQLIYDCCSSSSAYRPSMTVVCQRIGDLKLLL